MNPGREGGGGGGEEDALEITAALIQANQPPCSKMTGMSCQVGDCSETQDQCTHASPVTIHGWHTWKPTGPCKKPVTPGLIKKPEIVRHCCHCYCCNCCYWQPVCKNRRCLRSGQYIRRTQLTSWHVGCKKVGVWTSHFSAYALEIYYIALCCLIQDICSQRQPRFFALTPYNTRNDIQEKLNKIQENCCDTLITWSDNLIWCYLGFFAFWFSSEMT